MCQAAFASEVVFLCKFQAMLIHRSSLLVPWWLAWFIFSWLQEFEAPKRKPSTLVCSDDTVSSWKLCHKKKKLVKFLPTPYKMGASWWPQASWAKFTWFWKSFPKAPSDPVRAETNDGTHRSHSLNSKCWCHSLSFPSQAGEDDRQCLPSTAYDLTPNYWRWIMKL